MDARQMVPFKFYSSTKLGKKPTEVKKTLQPVPDDEATLEAEKNETAVVSDGSGLPALFKIGGKSHAQGGTPLNLPAQSFIFSKDKSMRITDPKILEMFNMSARKSGYTPAEISKKYDINNYRKVLADKNTDKLQRDTAESMIVNYNEKLAKLALIQEAHKGYPSGIPMIAQPYLHSSQMDMSQIFAAQGQDVGDQEQLDMEQGKFGGQPKFNFFKKGGEYKGGGESETLRRVRVVAPKLMKTGGSVKYAGGGGVPANIKEKYDLIKGETVAELNKLYPGKKIKVDYTGESRTVSQAQGYAKRMIGSKSSTHLLGAARDFNITIDGKPAPADAYKKVLWSVAEKNGLHRLPTKAEGASGITGDTDMGHIGLVAEGKGKTFEQIATKYPELLSTDTAKQALKDMQDYKTKNPQDTTYDAALSALEQVPGKGISLYKSKRAEEKTPTGKDPSASQTADWFKEHYKQHGIDADNVGNKEAQSQLYDKADPFKKAFMWGNYGDTKQGATGSKFEQFAPLKDESFGDYKVRLTGKFGSADKLNEELGKYKNNFADGNTGGRTAHLLETLTAPIDNSAPAAIVEGGAGAADVRTNGDLPDLQSAGVNGVNKQTPADFWLQDIVKTAGAAGDMYRIKKYLPWQAPYNPHLPQATFYDPNRELSANAEQSNIAATAAGMFGSPQELSARLSSIQGQGAQNAANILGKYNNLNVSASNQNEQQRTNALNEAGQYNATNATNLYDKTVIANQNFDNAKAMARQNIRSSFIDAITNRAQTQAVNSMYPQYHVDPLSGGLVNFTTGKAIKPTTGEGEARLKWLRDNKAELQSLGVDPKDYDKWSPYSQKGSVSDEEAANKQNFLGAAYGRR